MSGAFSKRSKSRTAGFWFFTIFLLLTILGVSFFLLAPAPPRSFTIAAGDRSGAYYAFAEQYRELLAQDGIELTILSTAGSTENLALLNDEQSPVSVAFVQGGVASAEDQQHLLALGSLYLEPLWIFARKDLDIKDLGDFSSLHIGCGPEGSGTRALVSNLLQLAEVEVDCEALSVSEAADQLLARELDMLFMVSSVESDIVEKLMGSGAVRLLSLDQARAVERLRPFLAAVELPEGYFDLNRNLPAASVSMLAPAAMLVVREDFHPALIDLLVGKMRQVHGQSSAFVSRGTFPSGDYLDLPLSADAERVLRNGPSVLNRIFPFWAATLIARMKFMIIPLITLLLPMVKLFPALYRWRVRYRIMHWYKDMQRIDAALALDEEVDRALLLSRCEHVREDVAQIHVPAGYADQLYLLRFHLDRLRDKLAGSDA